MMLCTDIEPNTQKKQKYQMITFISATIKSWLVFRILTKNGGNAAKMFFLVLFAVTISYNDLIWEEVAGS